MRSHLLVSAMALLASAASAHAGIVTSLAGTAQVSTGYAYTYNVSLTGQLDAVGPNTAPQFGTLYDFGTVLADANGRLYTATGLLASSFSFTFANLSTPTAFATAPVDNASLTNVRYTYTGSTNYVDSGVATTLSSFTLLNDGPHNLGTFTVISPYSQTTLAYFDGQDYKGANNTLEGNVGFAAVPSPVPEPSSLALLGTGLLGAVSIVRRRLQA